MPLDDVVSWESEPPKNARVRIEAIDRFDARGMRRIYGRGDADSPSVQSYIWKSGWIAMAGSSPASGREARRLTTSHLNCMASAKK